MPLFDFFKNRIKTKKSDRRHDKSNNNNAVEKSTSTSMQKPSKRSVKERSMNQSVASQIIDKSGPSITLPKVDSKQRKESRKIDKYHKPIVQKAEDVRTKKTVDLHLEELHWHSGGVFSNVYRGTMTAPERMEVAIKKTWPKESVRSDEMIILAAMRRASPRNIIKLLYIFKNTAPDGTECEAFIFAFMPETLDKVIRRGLNPTDIKIYIWQLFNGLDFLAANRIAHRDIKPINILVNKDTGELQIGDFGSAKVISSRERSSAYQVTRYYRPPEMLLGSNHYSHQIDVWSAGCVLGEMIKGRVLFRGSDSENQFHLIQAALGTPTEEELKVMRVKTVHMKSIPKLGLLASLRLQSEYGEPIKLTTSMAAAVALLRRILVYHPDNRYCGKDLLEDPFFEDVLSPTCVRENGQKTVLERQSDDTMCHQCFEKSQRSSRVSRIAPAPVHEPAPMKFSVETTTWGTNEDGADTNITAETAVTAATHEKKSASQETITAI